MTNPKLNLEVRSDERIHLPPFSKWLMRRDNKGSGLMSFGELQCFIENSQSIVVAALKRINSAQVS
jgi:hypothetical protein